MMEEDKRIEISGTPNHKIPILEHVVVGSAPDSSSFFFKNTLIGGGEPPSV